MGASQPTGVECVAPEAGVESTERRRVPSALLTRDEKGLLGRSASLKEATAAAVRNISLTEGSRLPTSSSILCTHTQPAALHVSI